MRFRPIWLVGLFLSALCCGLAPAQKPQSATTPVNVFVGIPPLAYFVERVGGPHVRVGVMVGPGHDVHTYEPTPKLLAELSKARLFFSVGMPFEETITRKAKSTFKNLRMVDTTGGIKLRVFEEGEEDDHGHAKPGHSHAKAGHKQGHGGVGERDPHVWLDPKLVKIQAAHIAEALGSVDPEHAQEYRKNLKDFQSELDALDAELAQALAPLKGKPLYVYHPAFGYFADAYGLKQVSVETGGKEPSAKHLAALIKEAKADGVKVIFVQPQFSKKSALALAEAIGGVVVEIDDLSRDYMPNMRKIAEKVGAALKRESN
jgi:zinc transport system substrate-binding protein